VPDGWCWTRIQNIAQFQGGFAYKSSKYVEKSNNIIIRIGNVKNNELNPQISTKYISNEYASETSSYKIRSNDILFTMTGTRGKRDYFYSCLVSLKELKDTCLYLNQRVGCLRIFDIDYIFPKFFLITLQSRFVLDAIFKTETGNVSQGNIGSTATLNLLVPILPVNEQKRIIGKINLLFALVKNIEKNKLSLIDDVSSAKTKILDLAIRGKLVPQEPNDEPASVLLERIRAEKEELIKQGKIKRDKKESVIFKGDDNSYYEKIGDTVTCIDDKIPFEIPESWCWTRLNHITINHDSYRKPINSSDRKNRIVGKKKSKLYPYYGATGQVGLIDDYLFDGEYILLGEDAAPFLDKNAQKAYMIIGKSWVNNHAHILKSLILSKYLTHCLNSINYLNYVYGTTRLKLTQENMNKILIPVPPFKEQQRLIHKIDFIMGSINQINLSNKSK